MPGVPCLLVLVFLRDINTSIKADMLFIPSTLTNSFVIFQKYGNNSYMFPSVFPARFSFSKSTKKRNMSFPLLFWSQQHHPEEWWRRNHVCEHLLLLIIWGPHPRKPFLDHFDTILLPLSQKLTHWATCPRRSLWETSSNKSVTTKPCCASFALNFE